LRFRGEGLVLLVWGLRVGVWGSGFRVQGSGFRVQGSEYRVYGMTIYHRSDWRTLASPRSALTPKP
jgi:hypothetical protein